MEAFPRARLCLDYTAARANKGPENLQRRKKNNYHDLMYKDPIKAVLIRRWDMSHEINECNENKAVTTGEVTAPAPGSTPEQPQRSQGKTVSPEKLAANCANSHKSTGPRTKKGKEKSKQNSRKHGFFARQPLPAGEAGDKLWEEYGDLVAGIWEYYQPQGYIEGLLTEKIATESIRYSRFLTYEARYIGQQQALHWEGVDRILRFQSAINRQLFQAMHELERVQQKRKANPNPTNLSDPEQGDEGAGRTACDVQNTAGISECTNVETSAIEI